MILKLGRENSFIQLMPTNAYADNNFLIVLKLPAIVYIFFKWSSSNDTNVRAFWSANTKVINNQIYIQKKIPKKHERAYNFPTPLFESITCSFRCHRHNKKHSNLNIRSILSFSATFLARECVLSNYIHGLNGLNHYSGTGAM